MLSYETTLCCRSAAAWQLEGFRLYFCSKVSTFVSKGLGCVWLGCYSSQSLWEKYEKKATSLSCCSHDGMSLLFELEHGVKMYSRTADSAIQHETYCTTIKIPPYVQSCTSTVNHSNANWVGRVWICLNKANSWRKVAPAVHMQTHTLTHTHVLHCQDMTITANYGETAL